MNRRGFGKRAGVALSAPLAAPPVGCNEARPARRGPAFAPVDYLGWVRQRLPLARHDLLGSGVRELDPNALGPAPAGNDYEAWGRYWRELGARYGVRAEEMAPGVGASGALFVTYATLLGRGDEVLIETPAYEPLVRVAEGQGLRVRRFARRRDRGYAVEPDEVERSLGPDTRAVVVTNLHNPSGVIAAPEALHDLARRLARRDAYLIVDEAYGELAGFGRGGGRATARHLGPNVAVVASLSKCFGLGWARVGFAFLPEAAAGLVDAVTTQCVGHLPPTLAAYGALALTSADRLLAPTVAELRAKRVHVDAWLDRHRERLAWVAPCAESPFGLVRDRRAPSSDLRPRIEAGLREHGVLVAPGAFFGEPDAFRLSWTLPPERLGEALERLERALDLTLCAPRAKKTENIDAGQKVVVDHKEPGGRALFYSTKDEYRYRHRRH